MTEPTPEHIQRACDLLNEGWRRRNGPNVPYSSYDDGNSNDVQVLARQLAHAEAEAERVRKVAEEILVLAKNGGATIIDPMMAIAMRAKSLLPAEPVDPVESLYDEIIAAGGWDHNCQSGWEREHALAALKRGIELAKQGNAIDIVPLKGDV